MNIKKQDVYVPYTEDGKWWVDSEDEIPLQLLKDRYVLTEDELENIKFLEYNKGYEAGKTYGLIPF